MNYSFWNNDHTKKTEIDLQVNSNWKELASKVDNKYFTSIWKMVDNNDGIIQQNELNLFKKLLNIADNLIDTSKNNNIIEDEESKTLIEKIKDGSLTKGMKNNPVLIKNRKIQTLTNYSYIESYTNENNELKIQNVNVEFDFDRINMNSKEPAFIRYYRIEDAEGISDYAIVESLENPKLLNAKKQKSQVGTKVGWSEGTNRHIKVIQISKYDGEDKKALNTIIKELKHIGKQVGFKVQLNYYDLWHEDGSVQLHDGARYFPNLNIGSQYEILASKDVYRYKNGISNTGAGAVSNNGRGVLYKETISEQDIVDGKSYIEGGNVLNTRLIDGTPAAIIGEESIYYTLNAIYGTSEYMKIKNLISNNNLAKQKYFDIAKKQIAEDLHLKDENITYIPQLDFHIDMSFRPLQDGTVAIPDYEEAIKILKEKNINITNYDSEQMKDVNLIDKLTELNNMVKNIINDAENQLIKSGYKIVKIPCFTVLGKNSYCYEQINYMNGITGTSNNKKNETYYITNTSGHKELDDIIKKYFKKVGIDKTFFVSSTQFLKRQGGIDCMTQEM